MEVEEVKEVMEEINEFFQEQEAQHQRFATLIGLKETRPSSWEGIFEHYQREIKEQEERDA